MTLYPVLSAASALHKTVLYGLASLPAQETKGPKASKKAKRAKGEPKAEHDNGPPAGADADGTPLADPSKLFGEQSGLSPLDRMVGMLSALVAQGEAAMPHVHVLIDNLPPEMLADVVIAYMEHLPDQPPAAAPAAGPGEGAGAGGAGVAAGAPGAAPEVKRDPRRVSAPSWTPLALHALLSLSLSPTLLLCCAVCLPFRGASMYNLVQFLWHNQQKSTGT